MARGTHPAGYAYPTIAAAITDALAGDTIMLESGKVFYEHITVTKNLNFDVLNSGTATIDGSSTGRIVTINSGLTVTFNNISFMHGTTTGNNNGGAITNPGTLTLTNCIFQSNSAYNGGAIYNTGTLNMNNCIFTSNTARNQGGAIWNSGALTVTNSAFTSNSVPNTNTAYNGGAIYNSAAGTLNVTGSTFTSNSAAVGGAILSYNTLNVTNCAFTSNAANSTTTGYGGGAIAFGNSGTQAKGILTVKSSTFNTNKAAYGGAIWDDGTVVINTSTFTGNTASAKGGALRNWGTITVTSSTFTGNTATTNADAISNYQGTATISFCRIVGNGVNDINCEYNAATTTLNAINNWWGTNSGPTSARVTYATGSTVTVNPWMVLKISATPTLIHISGTSTVTGDSTWNSNNVQPTGGYIPDGTPITFTSTLGTITNANTLNGKATTIFTASIKPGIATVNAITDNQSVNTQITIGRDDVYVSPNGNDSTGDGSQSNPLKTVSAGIAAIYPGGTLHITEGTYNEHNLVINSNMSIVGDNAVSTIINAQQLGNIFNILSGTTVTISNLTLENGLITGNGGAINNAGILTLTGNNFLNNAATGTGGTIYNTGTTIINFNRIIGTGNNIASPTGTVNATNNWWGSNSSPSGKVSGNVNINTWLVLTVNASKTSIPAYGNSNIIADLTHDQNGVYHDPVNGHVPDGIPINFTGNLGALTPVSTVLNRGTASATFTARSASGTAHINGIVDSQTSTVNITIGTSDMQIWVYDMNGQTDWDYGSSPEYTVELYNNGPDDATNVTVTITLPAGLTLNGYNPRCAGSTVTINGNTITWTIPYIGNQGSTLMDLLAKLTATGTVTLSANVTQNQNDPDNTTNTGSWDMYVAPASDIQVKQTVNNTTPHTGDTITYTITITNNGPNNATNIKINTQTTGLTNINPNIPAGTTYTNGIWTIPTLNNGTSITLTLTGTVTNINTQNTATFNPNTANQYDWDRTNNAQTLKPNYTNIGTSDMQIWVYDMNGQTDWDYGSSPEYTVELYNNGPDDATNVTVTITLPAGLTLNGYNPRCAGSTVTINGNTIIWTIPYIGNQGSTLMDLLAKLTATGTVTLSANVTQNQNDPDNTSNTGSWDMYVAPASDIQVKQTVNNTTPHTGDTITYTITITNNGPNNATNIKINTQTTGLTNINPNIPAGTTYTNGIWTIPTLNNGTSITLTLTGTVTNINTQNTATFNPNTANQYDWDRTNNAQTLYLDVQ